MAELGGSVKVAGALCLAALLGACTAMPTGGPVHTVGAGAAVGAPNINVPVRGPVAADTPRDIVDNFGAANTDYEEAYKVAKEFLADPNSWKPDGSVTVVSKVGETELVQPSNPSKDLTTVTVTDPLVGTIDQSGSFTPSQAGTKVSFTYSLKDTSDGWRIVSGFKPSVVLTQDQVNQAYESGYVYFLRPDGKMLVPSRVFLPAADAGALANDLVTNLLNGPPEYLAPSTPANTRRPSSVPRPLMRSCSQGADFRWRRHRQPQCGRRHAAACPARRARSPADLHAARSVARPQRGTYPGRRSAARQGRAGELRQHLFLPRSRRDAAHLLLRRRTRPHGRRAAEPGLGEAGNGGLQLIAPAVAPRVSGSSGQLIAGAVEAPTLGATAAGTSQTLYAGQPLQLKPLRSGGTFTRPSWDSLLNLWTVEQPAKSAGQQVLEAIVSPNGSTVTTVADPKLASDVILALRVSPDGTRVAVIAKSASTSQLLIGRISTDSANKVTIDQFRAVASDLTSATDCAWADAETVEVLVNGSTTVGLDSQIWAVDADGWSETQHAAPPGTVSGIAIAPGQPLVIALAGDKTIDEYESTSWVEIAAGTNPTYPG